MQNCLLHRCLSNNNSEFKLFKKQQLLVSNQSQFRTGSSHISHTITITDAIFLAVFHQYQVYRNVIFMS